MKRVCSFVCNRGGYACVRTDIHIRHVGPSEDGWGNHLCDLKDCCNYKEAR